MEGSKGNLSEINVTPMIDILLVLLIIFMVVVPAMPKGLQASLPQPPRTDGDHAWRHNCRSGAEPSGCIADVQGQRCRTYRGLSYLRN